MIKAESIQNKLNKSYGIVAKVLGESYEVYRPASIDSPLDTANYIDTQKAGFSLDETYKAVSKSGASIWLAWIDGRLDNLFNLQNGDMLHDNDTNDTYIMVGITINLSHQALKANNRITVERAGSTGYGDNDGTGFAPGNAATTTVIGTEIPCQILQPSSYGNAGYVPVSSNAEDTIPNFEIYLWDSKKEISVRDKITDSLGNTSEVSSILQTDIGTKLICRGIPQ